MKGSIMITTNDDCKPVIEVIHYEESNDSRDKLISHWVKAFLNGAKPVVNFMPHEHNGWRIHIERAERADKEQCCSDAPVKYDDTVWDSLFREMRVWNRQHDEYNKGDALHKPMSADEMKEYLRCLGYTLIKDYGLVSEKFEDMIKIKEIMEKSHDRTTHVPYTGKDNLYGVIKTPGDIKQFNVFHKDGSIENTIQPVIKYGEAGIKGSCGSK